MNQAPDKEEQKDTAVAPMRETPAPVRDDVTSMTAESISAKPEKDIMQTRGGKIINFFINKVLGFVGNSSLSVTFTYWANPHEGVKKVRRNVVEGVSNLFHIPPKPHENLDPHIVAEARRGLAAGDLYIKPLPPAKDLGAEPTHMRYRIGNGIRSTVEILMMMVAGFTTTLIMTPFVSRREKMAYWLNKKMGRDTDVVPFEMRKVPTPQTEEEWLQFTLQSKINTRQTAGDLWKGRLLSSLIIIAADFGLSDLALKGENPKPGKTAKPYLSQDAMAWSLGGKLYDKVLSKAGFENTVKRVTGFYERHEAGMGDIMENQTEIYRRLQASQERAWRKAHPNGEPFPGVHRYRGAIAEGTRLLAKELGWTFIMSEFVESFTNMFQQRRVHKQFEEAVEGLKMKGLITENYVISCSKDGKVNVCLKHVTKTTSPSSDARAAESELSINAEKAQSAVTAEPDKGNSKTHTAALTKIDSYAQAAEMRKEASATPGGAGIGA